MKTTAYILLIIAVAGYTSLAQREGEGGEYKNRERYENRERHENQERSQDRYKQEARERMGERSGPGEGGMHKRPGQGGGSLIDKFVNNPHVAEKLQLSDEQINKLKATAAKSKARQEELADAMKAAGKKQAEIMSSENVDREELKRTYEDLSKIRSEMGWLKTEELLSVKEVLNAEQGAKLRGMMQKMQQGGMRGGKGEGGMREGGMKRGDQGEGGMRGGMNQEEMKKKFQERREQWEQRRKQDEENERRRRDNEDKQFEKESDSIISM